MPTPSSLARLQQVMAFSLLACAIGWAWGWWEHRRLLAIAGALLIAGVPSLILGAEFLILTFVRRSDAAPAAPVAALLRAWWAESRQAAAVFGWRQPFRWRAIDDRLDGASVAGRHGVVLVHGFVCNRGFWTPWRERLEHQGRAHLSINLEPVFAGIDEYIPRLDAAVRQVQEATGLPPVLVCHSMGGLVARAWLRDRGDARAVAHVVTIGSPHAGTWLARFSHLPSGRQMRRGSTWLRELAQGEPQGVAGHFTCWWSDCDNIVMPPSTATLPGADNRFLAGSAHVQLAFRPEVIEGTLSLVAALDAGQASSSGSSRRRS